MAALIVLVVVQALIAGVVIFVLKRMLDRELQHAALEKIEHIKASSELKEIVVNYGTMIDGQVKSRIESIHKRKWLNVPLKFQHNPSLKGGVVIIAGDEELDFSIAGRLRHFWS